MHLANYGSTHQIYSQEGIQVAPGRRAQLRSFLVRHSVTDSNLRLLDLGCGDGTLLHVASELGIQHAEGVDLSPELVEKARKLGVAVTCQDVSAFLQQLPAESFGAVSAFDLLEHLDHKQLLFVCQNVWRVLQKGGKFLIHVPNGASPYAGRVLYGDITHERAYTDQSMHQLLRSVGFTSIQVEEDQPVPRGFISFLRLCIWKVLRLAAVFRLAVETGTFRNYHLTLNIFIVTVKT
jgi:SAM-dependent methyltransferase